MDAISTNDISNISEMLILLLVYSITETIKFCKKKADSEKWRKKIERQIKRLEFLYAIHFCTNNEVLIKQLYDEYKALGGNSYIDQMYQDWLAGINKKKKKRIKNKLIIRNYSYCF